MALDIEKLDVNEATHYLLGKGCVKATPAEWKQFQMVAVKLAHKVLGVMEGRTN